MKLHDTLYFYREGGMLDCNTYLIKGEKTMIVDVGLDKNLPSLISALQKDGIGPQTVDIITNTHLHIDHTWANEDFKEKSGARIEIAPIQKKYYAVSVRQTSQFFGITPVEFKEDGLIDSAINLGTVEIDVIPTPGHSPDGLLVELPAEKIWICGDTVIPIPYLASGDRGQLMETLRGLLSSWAGEAVVMGHDRVLFGEEARGMIECNIRYLARLGKVVAAALAGGTTRGEILKIPLSQFGIPEDALSGLAGELHRVNLDQVYRELSRGE